MPVFALPASTETTASSVAASVMRRPSTLRGVMPRRSSSSQPYTAGTLGHVARLRAMISSIEG